MIDNIYVDVFTINIYLEQRIVGSLRVKCVNLYFNELYTWKVLSKIRLCEMTLDFEISMGGKR